MAWREAINWSVPMAWSSQPPQPLFKRLELDEILASEQALIDPEGAQSH